MDDPYHFTRSRKSRQDVNLLVLTALLLLPLLLAGYFVATHRPPVVLADDDRAPSNPAHPKSAQDPVHLFSDPIEQRSPAQPGPPPQIRMTQPGQREFTDGDRSPNIISGTLTAPGNRVPSSPRSSAPASPPVSGARASTQTNSVKWVYVHSNSCSRLDERAFAISAQLKSLGTKVPDWRRKQLVDELLENRKRRQLGLCH